MYRTWRFPVKQFFTCWEKPNRYPFSFSGTMDTGASVQNGEKPYSVLRKAACMFGWDWGLSFS